MNNKQQFGLYEAVSLVSIVMVSKISYTSISVIIKQMGTAAWYGTLISSLVSMFLFLFLYLLMKRFPGKNLLQIFDIVLGKFIGKIVSLIFAFYIIFYAGSSLREFVEMIKAYNLPYTQPSLILVAFITVTILIAYHGIEGLGRVSAIFFIPLVAGLILILVLASPYYHFDTIKPILGYGIKTTLISGSMRSSAYDEVVILAIIINSIHGLKNFKRAGLLSITISGVVISISVLLNIAAFEYNVGGENTSAFFQLTRIIYFNRFFQRVESLFLFIWVIASVITVSITFYMSMYVYCHTFKIKNHRPLILPFSFILFMVSIYSENFSQIVEFNIVIIRLYSFILLYGVPILVLLISILRGKKGGIVNENNG